MLITILYLYLSFILIAIIGVVVFGKRIKKSLRNNQPSDYVSPELTNDMTLNQLKKIALYVLKNQDIVKFEQILGTVQNLDTTPTQFISSLELNFTKLNEKKATSSICYLLKNYRTLVEKKFDDTAYHLDFIDHLIDLGNNLILSSVLPLVPDRVNKMNYDNWTTPLSYAILQKPVSTVTINILLDFGAKSFSIGNHDLNEFEGTVILPQNIIDRIESQIMKYDLSFFRTLLKK